MTTMELVKGTVVNVLGLNGKIIQVTIEQIMHSKNDGKEVIHGIATEGTDFYFESWEIL